MNETAVRGRAGHKDGNCKGMKQAGGRMLVFIRRSEACAVGPLSPSRSRTSGREREREPCVALHTYTYANARDGMASGLECPSHFEGLPAPGPGHSAQRATPAARALNHLSPSSTYPERT